MEVTWIAGDNKGTEFTYDIGTEDVTTKEVRPTDQEAHETLRVSRYSQYLPTRRTVDLPGDYGFTVSSAGLQITHDTRVAPRVRRDATEERPQSVQGDDGPNTTVRVRRAIRENQAPQPSDASTLNSADQARRDLYERLQPRRGNGRRKSNNRGPLGESQSDSHANVPPTATGICEGAKDKLRSVARQHPSDVCVFGAFSGDEVGDL